MEITKAYYQDEDESVLPRSIATFEAFQNAMSLDIAMGGSTNTVLHLLAAAQEAQVPFFMKDFDDLSRRVPNLCKVAPSTPLFHMEDVHRAGGTSGLCIGHVSPEAASEGAIGLIEEGDSIEVDIPNRTLTLAITDEDLAQRRQTMEAKGAKAWQPVSRDRQVTPALKFYALMTTSADKGAVRDLELLQYEYPSWCERDFVGW